jgi:hypothetical protein
MPVWRMTSAGTDLPVGRLVVAFVLCLIAGAAVALVIGFLLYPVLPHLLHRDSGGVFFLVGMFAAFVLYGRAKSWMISGKERGPTGPAA